MMRSRQAVHSVAEDQHRRWREDRLAHVWSFGPCLRQAGAEGWNWHEHSEPGEAPELHGEDDPSANDPVPELPRDLESSSLPDGAAGLSLGRASPVHAFRALDDPSFPCRD